MSVTAKVVRLAAIAAMCAGVAFTAAAPAGAAPDAAPNIAVVSTRFDKQVYQPGETAAVRFKFTNYGSVDATKVANYAGGNGDSWELQVTDWGGIGYGEGITIRAGETVTVTLRGIVPTSSYNVGKVTIAYGFIAENGDADEENNHGTARASVPGATGSTTGESYHDANADHRNNPGEGLWGVKITVVGLYDIEKITTTFTDQDGRFRLDGLPVGEYEVRVTPPPGWQLVYGGNVTRTEVRATGTSFLVLEVEPV